MLAKMKIRLGISKLDWKFGNEAAEIYAIPEMSNGISSKQNQSTVGIDVLINPSGPSGQGSLVCFENLESRVHIVAFLVVVFSVKTIMGNNITH